MKPVNIAIYALVILLLPAFLVHAAFATDLLYFTSTPGSWIGQGQTLTLSPVGTQRIFNLGAYTNTDKFFVGGYELDIVGPNNTLPTVGFYDHATRWPFNGGSPGMWFTAPGRGDNAITGWFNVFQADYNPDGSISAFAVDFKQFDETSTTNYTQGSVRYHSTIPIPGPEPTTALFIIPAIAILLHRRSARLA